MSIHLSVVMPVNNERYLVAESVRRVLAVRDDTISHLDLVIVDDGSTDGTRDILRRLAKEHADRITLIELPRNAGKGAAVAAGVARATGAVTVIQDADLEYNPADLPRLLVPFIREGADAVFGSRFLAADYRRVLYFRHSLGNRLLTFLSNVVTDVNLTDVETCYKAVRTELLQSIPLRSRDFRIEVELTIKLAKRGARLFEVPISYAGRTYREGKKIGWRDGLKALGAMAHWWLVDDLYRPDAYGSNILVSMSEVPRFNRWMSDVVRPFVGSRVLEMGAGLGNMSRMLLPRDRYTVSDINPQYLDFLTKFADGKPYMDVLRIDLGREEDFTRVAGQYDTVVCLNVLEHIADEARAIRNIRSALEPGGRAIILVPQNPRIFGTLDVVLGHERRYTRATLPRALESEGLRMVALLDFNRVTTPVWWLNGRVLRRRHFGRAQLKAVNLLTWLFRLLEHVLPWKGVSLVAVAERPR
ncbi:MAG: glycosyltransferase [Gemmatimonadota bacterium]